MKFFALFIVLVALAPVAGADVAHSFAAQRQDCIPTGAVGLLRCSTVSHSGSLQFEACAASQCTVLVTATVHGVPLESGAANQVASCIGAARLVLTPQCPASGTFASCASPALFGTLTCSWSARVNFQLPQGQCTESRVLSEVREASVFGLVAARNVGVETPFRLCRSVSDTVSITFL